MRFDFLAAVLLCRLWGSRAVDDGDESQQMETLLKAPDEDVNIFERIKYERIQPRIVGGQPARDDDYPFFVHALDRQLCGGTLIHPDVVLTAATCAQAFRNEVIVGSTDLFGRDGAERVAVDSQHPHPLHMAGTKENDIMLIRLAVPSETALATLETEMEVPTEGQEVTVVGFGRTFSQGNVALQLRDVDMLVVGLETCRDGVDDWLIPDSHVCAGGGTSGVDACDGDAGGPLLDSDTLVQYGVVSADPGCGAAGSTGVYTRVSFYLDWITEFLCTESTLPPTACNTEPPSEPAQEPGESPSQVPTILPTPPATGVPNEASPAPSMSPSTNSTQEGGDGSKETSKGTKSSKRKSPSSKSSKSKGKGSKSGSKAGSKSGSKSESKSGSKSWSSSGKKSTSSSSSISEDYMESTVEPSSNSTSSVDMNSTSTEEGPQSKGKKSKESTSSSSDVESQEEGSMASSSSPSSEGKKQRKINKHREKKRAEQRRNKRLKRAANNRRRYPITLDASSSD